MIYTRKQTPSVNKRRTEHIKTRNWKIKLVLGLVGRKCASPQRKHLCLAEESTNSDEKSKGKGKDVHIMLQNDVLQLSPTSLFTAVFQSRKLPTCPSPQVKQCAGGTFQTRNKLISWNMSVRRENQFLLRPISTRPTAAVDNDPFPMKKHWALVRSKILFLTLISLPFPSPASLATLGYFCQYQTDTSG